MPKPAGLTNAQLSERTRTALLEATLEVITEKGFGKASTTEIARRAGVSRGAQVHHFPTKAALVAAATNYLFDRSTGEFRSRFQALPADERTFERATDLMWELLADDTFRAGLELIVAGGTDKALGVVVNDAVNEFQGNVIHTFVELFPEASAHATNATALVFAFSVLLGAAVYRQVGLDDLAEQSIAVLRTLAQATMPNIMAVPVPIEPFGSSSPLPGFASPPPSDGTN